MNSRKGKRSIGEVALGTHQKFRFMTPARQGPVV